MPWKREPEAVSALPSGKIGGDRDECDLKRRSAQRIILFVFHGSFWLKKTFCLNPRNLSTRMPWSPVSTPILEIVSIIPL